MCVGSCGCRFAMTPAVARCTGEDACGVRRELGLTRREAFGREFSLGPSQAVRDPREATAARDPSSGHFTSAIAAWNITSPLRRYFTETNP